MDRRNPCQAAQPSSGAHAAGYIFTQRPCGGREGLRELVDVGAKTAAEVGGFVLGDDVLAAKTLKESVNLVVSLGSLGFVGHLAHAADSSAGRLRPVAVLESPLLRLADSF